MKTPEKCEAILRKIVEIVNNDDAEVRIEQDWGGNSLTVYIEDSHTHVGIPEESFDNLIDGLYDVLHGGPGLSWAKGV